MFIGAKFYLREDRKRESTLGYKTIEIKERVLHHTKCFNKDSEDWPPRYTITSYEYIFQCLVNDDDTAQIMEEELESELLHGAYSLERGME